MLLRPRPLTWGIVSDIGFSRFVALGDSHITDPLTLEKFARDLCIRMGCRASLAMPVLTGAQAKRSSVRNTLSRSIRCVYAG